MVSRVSEIGEITRLSDALDSFRCCLDEDIEDFLRHKAIQFLERGWCSVYLIVDGDSFANGKIDIVAYFTLSHKAIISQFASKTAIRKTSGFKDSEVISFVLIGHLGKYKKREDFDHSKVVSVSISICEILDFAFEVIKESSNLIPCRCVLVECSDNQKVQFGYKKYGFKDFQFDGSHYQLYKEI